MNRQEKIKEIIELMNIPEFEKLICIKVEELKIILGKQIQFFEKIKREFKGEDRQRMQLFENRSSGRSGRTYFFELNRVADGSHKEEFRWIIRKIEPDPGLDLDEVMPAEVIEHLSRYRTDPAKIEFDEFSSEALERKFDIRSIKYNDSRIFGTIRPLLDSNALNESKPVSRFDTITLNSPRKKMENEEKYTELFRYMERYPEIREHIFTYFYMIQKPMVDSADEELSSSWGS